jgi:hypothetical protein
MVETITPAVHGGRTRRYWTSVVLHAFGATVSAAAIGLLLGGTGALLGAPWGTAGLVALAAVTGLYAAREAVGLKIPLPNLHRQVPEWWRTFFDPPVAAALYGLGLGVGFLTYLSFGTYVAVAAGAVVFGDPLVGAALCAPFGLARGLSVAISDGGQEVVESLERLAQTAAPRAVNAGAMVLVLLAAAA